MDHHRDRRAGIGAAFRHGERICADGESDECLKDAIRIGGSGRARRAVHQDGEARARAGGPAHFHARAGRLEIVGGNENRWHRILRRAAAIIITLADDNVVDPPATGADQGGVFVIRAADPAQLDRLLISTGGQIDNGRHETIRRAAPGLLSIQRTALARGVSLVCNLFNIAAGDKRTARGENVGKRATPNADLQDTAVIGVFQIEALAEAQLRRCVGDENAGRSEQGVANAGVIRAIDGVGPAVAHSGFRAPTRQGFGRRRTAPPRRKAGRGDFLEILGEVCQEEHLPQLEIIADSPRVGRAIAQLQRRGDELPAVGVRGESEKCALARAGGERAITLGRAGEDHTVARQQCGDQIGRGRLPGVLQTQGHRHSFTRIDHAARRVAIARDQGRTIGHQRGRGPGVINDKREILVGLVRGIGHRR